MNIHCAFYAIGFGKPVSIPGTLAHEAAGGARQNMESLRQWAYSGIRLVIQGVQWMANIR
jgi:hypothetical protein